MFLWFFGLREELDRLRSTIEQIQIVLDGAVQDGGSTPTWAATAKRYLDAAHVAYSRRDPGLAWPAAKAASRQLLGGLDRSSIVLEADRVRREAAEKLSGWRKDRVADLLMDSCRGCDGGVPYERFSDDDLRERVACARQIFDDHMDNVYGKLSLVGVSLLRMIGALVVGLVLVALVVAAGWASDDAQSPMGSWRLLLATYALGGLGALLSGTTDIVSIDRGQRIPDVRSRITLLAARPFVGAASALVVLVVITAGFSGITIEPNGRYAVAVLAGFSERFTTRAVGAAVERVSS